MNNNLPIIAIFLEALSLPYKHYQMLLKVGMPIIVTLTVILTLSLTPFSSDSDKYALIVASRMLIGFAFILSLVMAIVGCHRIFLLNSNPAEESKLLNWTGNEIKYIGWWLFIGVCSTLVALPFSSVVSPFIKSPESAGENIEILITYLCLMNIPILYVVARWSLVLPSAAIGLHGKSLTWSWKLSSGNGWRLTLLIGFIPLIIQIISYLLPTYDSIFFTLFYLVCWLVLSVIEIGLLSLSYRFLVADNLYVKC